MRMNAGERGEDVDAFGVNGIKGRELMDGAA